MLFSFHPSAFFALLVVVAVQVLVHIFHSSCHLLAVLVNSWSKVVFWFKIAISRRQRFKFNRFLNDFGQYFEFTLDPAVFFCKNWGIID